MTHKTVSVRVEALSRARDLIMYHNFGALKPSEAITVEMALNMLCEHLQREVDARRTAGREARGEVTNETA